MSASEREALRFNKSNKLYIKYFDVEINKNTQKPKPIAVITFSDTLPQIQIVPVVYLKNEVFKINDTLAIHELAKNITHLIRRINTTEKIIASEIQFDCDWTNQTANSYFLFLKYIKSYTNLFISATIRLHQIKYPSITKIPPVDKGILMYYNMGKISANNDNSILDNQIAKKYISSITNYPLPLSVALPIFSWGIKSNAGKVNALLNKMNEHYFLTDTNFTSLEPNHFLVKNSCFKSGYYFKEGEDIKIEYATKEQLLDAAENLKSYFLSPPELIFYDLDTLNLKRYEKTSFQKIMAKFN